MHTVSPVLAEQWQALHFELSGNREEKQQLAGLFLGYVPEGFSKKSVLYFGKATKGEFLGGYETHKKAFNGTSGFWHFAREISQIVDSNSRDLSNLAWSNVCKIGVVKDNPSNPCNLLRQHLQVRRFVMKFAFGVQDWWSSCVQTLRIKSYTTR